MARRPRLQFPGAVYHVMSRGNRKAPIFDDDADRHRFLATLADAARRYDPRVYAACLMGNHYHLVFDTPRGNLSAIMQYLNGVYAQASNRRHQRSGHLFEARFRSLVVQRESYLRRVCRYVVLNPVRAGLTKDAANWPWSTYRATAGLELAPAWLHVHWTEWAFAANSQEEAQRKYRTYVNSPVARKTRIDLQSVVVGPKAFKALADETNRLRADRLITLDHRVRERPPLDTLFVDVDGCPLPREEGIHAAHIMHGYHLAEIAAYLGLHRSTVSRLIARLR